MTLVGTHLLTILMLLKLGPRLETSCMKHGVRVGRAYRNCDVAYTYADYMVPQMQAAGVDDAFKYISLQIGSNDLCSACNEAVTGNR